MKKAPAPTKTQGAFENHETQQDFTLPTRFTGTENPRHLRAIAALLRRPMPRESLDHVAGCSNAPELMAELRRRGLDAPCERISFIDRDGYACRPGVYSLTTSDRRKIYKWQAKRGLGNSGERA